MEDPDAQCRGKMVKIEYSSRVWEIRRYPIHDLYPIIWTRLIIVFQSIKLVLDCFFSTKLQGKGAQ